MCGIAGAFGDNPNNEIVVSKMIKKLSHRGSDNQGIYIDNRIVLAHKRLAIMGGSEGNQPVYSENNDVIVVANGEIFNFKKLTQVSGIKADKECLTCDTNIIPELYKNFGCKMFEMINGQFAMAIWDKTNSKLILARDRFGQKPLYYKRINNQIFFSSEIVSLLEVENKKKINEKTLVDICTTWGTLGEKTIYNDIFSVNPGSYVVIDVNGIVLKKTYYFPTIFASTKKMGKESCVLQLDYLLKKAVLSHQISDVPISFYLSGGIDSSLIVALASNEGKKEIDTFSISFEKDSLDESEYQDLVANKFNTNHHRLYISEKDIIENFYDCVKHVQTPILRLGIVPMYLLSKYVHECGFKVALSGEGADELFGGYDIFKENKIRKFCEADPKDVRRGNLYSKINTYVDGYNATNTAALTAYYNKIKSNELFSSHLLRFQFGNYCEQFFSENVKQKIFNYLVTESLKEMIPVSYNQCTSLGKAQYVEIITFMENYLLSSQGDRVSMANTVECRYPFLDNEVVSFACELEDRYKLNGLNEKYILKEVAKRYLPMSIINRKKFPYRAIINHKKLLKDERIKNMISKEMIKKTDIFNSNATEKFKEKILHKDKISEKELMLLLFICSTQILFIGE